MGVLYTETRTAARKCESDEDGNDGRTPRHSVIRRTHAAKTPAAGDILHTEDRSASTAMRIAWCRTPVLLFTIMALASIPIEPDLLPLLVGGGLDADACASRPNDVRVASAFARAPRNGTPTGLRALPSACWWAVTAGRWRPSGSRKVRSAIGATALGAGPESAAAVERRSVPVVSVKSALVGARRPRPASPSTVGFSPHDRWRHIASSFATSANSVAAPMPKLREGSS